MWHVAIPSHTGQIWRRQAGPSGHGKSEELVEQGSRICKQRAEAAQGVCLHVCLRMCVCVCARLCGEGGLVLFLCASRLNMRENKRCKMVMGCLWNKSIWVAMKKEATCRTAKLLGVGMEQLRWNGLKHQACICTKLLSGCVKEP